MPKSETWKSIPSFESYSVSSHGRVKRTIQSRSNMPKILKPWIESHGYCQVELSNKDGQKTFRVHRLVLSVFMGDPKKGQVCNHKDGDKQNNNIDNLEWCSSSYNMKHSYKNGLHSKRHGEMSHYAKLTKDHVLYIRGLLENGVKCIDLANNFGVSRFCIYDIRDRKTWRHI